MDLFMPSRSTNLVLFTNFIFSSITSHIQVDAFYSDFSRAFYSVNHDLFIRNLENMGVSGSVLKWLQSFLTNSSVQVKIDNYTSKPFRLRPGVPQDSHLG